MSNDSVWSISPLDGRYYKRLGDLKAYVSEGGLVLNRIKVECAWLLHLSQIPGLPLSAIQGKERVQILLENWRRIFLGHLI